MGKVALWGAAGAIGTTVANVLREQNRPYRVVGRSRESLAKAFGTDPLAEIVTWDPADPASVKAAAEGVDAIVYLVGVEYWRFDLHPTLMKATIDGAIAAGVDRMLLIGTVYPYGKARTKCVREDHPREPHTVKGRYRKEQEDLLLDADRAGKLHGAVLRLPDFYGPGVEKSFIGEIFSAPSTGKTANLIGPIDREHEFLYVPDAGPVIVRLLDEPRAFGRVWHLGGAGTITTRALVEEVKRASGKPIKTLVANKTILRGLGLFDPMMRELVEMHYLNSEPLVLDDSALAELIGPVLKTSYADGVRKTLALSGATTGSR